MAGDERFVYVLRNTDRNPNFYVGLSSDVGVRLADQNMGRCRFELYLKPALAAPAAKRHFEP